MSNDAIAKSKRILALVDDYHDKPTSDTRTALRKALMDEFEPYDRAALQAQQGEAKAARATLSDEQVIEQVTDLVGLGHGAWDMVDGAEIVQAFRIALAAAGSSQEDTKDAARWRFRKEFLASGGVIWSSSRGW